MIIIADTRDIVYGRRMQQSKKPSLGRKPLSTDGETRTESLQIPLTPSEMAAFVSLADKKPGGRQRLARRGLRKVCPEISEI
jgi:hypothetical protein